ncbi:transcription-repair coupling factor [Bacillus sp. 2205SS5-2]|uniref:transcription-repair coupling factor n=1 Tax=Bacillus sp. 2205SS5-2 TaxID=3109031 RepID=UPI003005EE00
MQLLYPLFSEQEELQSIFEGIEEGLSQQLIAGLSGSSRGLLVASSFHKMKRSSIVVTHNLLQAQKLYEDIVNLVGEEYTFLYPADELIAAEMSVASPELRGQRIDTLNQLIQGNKGIYILPMAGLRKILPPTDLWAQYQLSFQVGEEIDLEDCLVQLVQMGYHRAGMITTPGEFSVRGGILDIYPLTLSEPIRIELFDTEVDSIRRFGIEDQRSIEKLQQIMIGPASELLFHEEHLTRTVNRLPIELAKSLKKIKNEVVKEQLSQNIGFDLEKLRNGQLPDQMFKYMSIAYEEPASFLDYVDDNSLLFLDEYSRIQEISETLEKEETDWYISLLEAGEMIHDLSISHSLKGLLSLSSIPKIYLSLFLRHIPNANPENIVNISCKPMQSFHGQMNVLKGEIERWRKSRTTVLILAPNEERATKLQHVLEDYEIQTSLNLHDEALTGEPQIMVGNLNSGFEFPMMKFAVITEEELFNKKAKKTPRRQKLTNAERIKNYSELKVGDHVVHVNHGIAKYLGIETLEINGVHKDYLHLKYHGNDKLYVPVEQIELIQKYVASENKEPKLYKLGGSEWNRVKKKVQSSVQDIADDLIKLYAEREAAQGYAFSPDGEMQRDFEAQFSYQETEDQLRSIHEIKLDMEKIRPMDRLLCGDVGYGKTEVAIRAAFKAVSDGKQVAILVPTTILAQQHYETIKERLQDFPMTVGLLSRFRTKKQQTETMKEISKGTVDIVIGTHRLLSKDIHYRDLGLLVIDEEQRFGVTHKEKIKQLKTNIDVLTLTATPIPRTLHMSMLGVRDLSVIETPPENRYPVQTYVMEYNGGLIREAIERELARNGQVYFLYNRVEDIERKADEIAALIPEARVTYAHGRMSENELESVILSFLDGEFDVLVTTTIIETGVDIPNVNTLVVYDADRMGLSQLYQLRGRVGRSNRVAYAYFTYRKDKVLTEVAEKRLQAIKEFTELGSGFKIAMRDLSIRGAGNLLGAEQHGFIDSVGFDLYSQMLKEAIDERKGEVDSQPIEEETFEIDISIDAYIPEIYIPDGHQKIQMYKRVRSLGSLEEVDELKEELIDRFGEYPEEVAYLLQVAEMKIWAKTAKLQSMKQVKNEVVMYMTPEGTNEIDGSKVFALTNKHGRWIGLGLENNSLKITFNTKQIPFATWFNAAYDIILKLESAKKEG